MTQPQAKATGKEALHFGAGNIGRGFIGALLARSGYHVTFADINAEVIEALQAKGAYDLHILDKDTRTERVRGVTGVRSDGPEVVPAIAQADIITTAVGPNVLPIIAPTLAQGIAARMEAGAGPLNIIACENKVGASSFLRGEVLKHLDGAGREYLEAKIGFPNASVDRIVPPFEGSAEGSGHVLDVGVEEFYEWYVEGPKFKGGVPNIAGMKVTDDLMAYVQRKLYTLNTGHAAAAYLGALKGIGTVAEAMADADTAALVRAAMEESGAALVREHGFEQAEHAAYIDRVAARFQNPHIVDEVARVGRQPIRKLGPEERLIGPARMAARLELPNGALARVAAAALHFQNADDPQAAQMQQKIAADGVRAAITEYTGEAEGSDLHEAIVREYAALAP